MDTNLKNLDWALIQSFLAVAETGSLSAAARQMNASQPTIGRHIKAMERHLNAELFVRRARGLELTLLGSEIVRAAQNIRTAVKQIELTAAGQQSAMAGTVRITSSVWMSTMHLPAMIAHIRRVEPQIDIELLPSDHSHNLLFREADIAVRLYRPQQPDLVARYLGELEFGAFASKAYMAEHGTPTSLEAFFQHHLVGYNQKREIIRGFGRAGYQVDREFFKTRCDDDLSYWALVQAGCGIGFGQRLTGSRDSNLQEIDLDLELPTLPVWLAAPEMMRRTPRIRRVWDHLADSLTALLQSQTKLS